jgi:opacity protein-like surface antigen
MKKVSLAILAAATMMSGAVLADNHTVSLGYAQSDFENLGDIRGVNVQYRYEWDSPLSVMGSFTYMSGRSALYQRAGDAPRRWLPEDCSGTHRRRPCFSRSVTFDFRAADSSDVRVARAFSAASCSASSALFCCEPVLVVFRAARRPSSASF